jgi:hypothetical protein
MLVFPLGDADALESVSNRFLALCLENSVGQLGIVESAASWSSRKYYGTLLLRIK